MRGTAGWVLGMQSMQQLSLSVELGCNEHQQPAVWLVAVAHEARWSRAETPRTRAAAASGQQTCKQCCSKRASQRLANVQANVPAAASGSWAAAATVDKPRQQNRADLAFGPEVNGFTSLRSQIPGFVVDGPIWHCCESSWTYGAFNSMLLLGYRFTWW